MKPIRSFDEPRLSAIICTFCRPDSLEQAILSLLQQSLTPKQYEIIVVDNNSQDKTAETVQNCIIRNNNGPTIRFFLEKSSGLSNARNLAIRSANANIVAFLDDDAIADPHWLEELLQIYEKYPDAWAVGGKVLPLWGGTRPQWLKDSMLRSLSIVEWGDKIRPLIWPERIIGTNCSFRKMVFTEIGYFDNSLGRKGALLLGNEDTEIQERIHINGKLVYYTPEAIVHHQVPALRMTKKYFYSRAYGTGRSQAILTGNTKSKKIVLRQALSTGYWLFREIISLIINWFTDDEVTRFEKENRIAAKFGFIYQIIINSA